MRSMVPVLLVVTLLSGCATADQAAGTGGRNAQQVQSLYDAFGRGDVPTVLAALDPQIVWLEAESINYSDRNPYHGPQAVVEGVFMRIGQDWNDYRLNIERIVDGGDTVVALGRYAATNKSTGRPLNAQFAHVWTFRNGKAVGFQQYADTAQFARVTGEWR